MQRMGAREVQLYLSRDRGLKWQKVAAVAPAAGRFTFTARADGDYWFAVRTLDRAGRLHPVTPTIEPGLKVAIDTRQPQLRLALRQLRPGWVQLSWQAEDSNLDVTQLRLQYRQPGQTQWKTLGIVPKPTGQTQWAVPAGGNVAVRGTVSDLARNVGQSHVQTTIEPVNESNS